MFKNIRNAFSAHARRRRTFIELSNLSDRELNDIGISRGEIGRVLRDIR